MLKKHKFVSRGNIRILISEILWTGQNDSIATLKLFLQGVPEKNLYKQVLDELRSVDRVEYIHDLKIWSLDGEHNVITIRVGSALKTVEEYKLLKLDIYDSLAMFDFSYSTVEIEFTDEHSAVNEEVRWNSITH